MRSPVFRLLPSLLTCGIAFAAVETQSADDVLLTEFQNPPTSARPRVWWHWMNGNVTKEGIKLDLDWMRRVGIGGFQNFDASMGTPQVVEKRLAYMTPEWLDAFRYTADLASEYGLEMAIAASPGWSHTGGPWVKPEQAMKKLVWSETLVSGGRHFSGVLPPPPRTEGPFQDVPVTELLGPTGAPVEYYADVAVLAFPVTGDDAQSRQPIVTTSDDAAVNVAGALTDDSWLTSVKFKLAEGSCVTYDFRTPATVSSLTLAMPTASDFFRSPLARAQLDISDDGASYRKVADIPSGGFEQHTISFAPAKARYFRVCFAPPTPPAGGDDGPAPGANMAALPFGNNKRTALDVHTLKLFSAPRIHRFEHKAVFALAPNYYEVASPHIDGTLAVDPSKVIDLTSRVKPDGRLEWTPPAGRWKVARFGYSLTGKKNHPASAEATGFEVDKLDRNHVRSYLDSYLSMYERAVGSQRIRALLVDSIESGAQNWTEKLPEEFQRRRGYDVRPWMPALTGVIVKSAADSDRFLYDYRRTLGELIAENLYAEIARAAKQRGLVQYGEALESGRPVLGDDMEMRRHTSIPMAAMWTYGKKAGAPAPTAFADIRGAASVAHIYGQNLVAAESLTSLLAPWAFAPRDLQPMVDLEFALGVNRPVIHTSVHQPLIDKPPGLALAVFGQYFNRNETWAEQATPWISYLSRTGYLLQQGHFVADILYFFGEEAPLTSLYASQVTPDAPSGYGFDFANTDVLLNRLKVENGELTTATGMKYRALYLGGTSSRMTLPVLRKLHALVEQGAVVIGEKPVTTPSLADDAAEFARLAEELWKSPPGSGRIVATRDVNTALEGLGVVRDFHYTPTREDSNIMFLHRRIADGDVYFLTNRRDQSEKIEASFRVTGKRAEIWRADTGKSEPVSYRIEQNRTLVPLSFAPSEAYFVVFRAPASTNSMSVGSPTYAPLATLADEWTVTFQANRGAPATPLKTTAGSWTQSTDPGVRYFSGSATYARALDIPAAWQRDNGRLILDLGDVRELAEVAINDRTLGVLWRPPYKVDITEAVKRGTNRLEIRVTNLWVNRLIGDAQPNAKKITFTVDQPYLPDAPLRPSGLIGPVTIERLR